MRSGADLGRKSNLGKILRSECRRDVRAILGWQRQGPGFLGSGKSFEDGGKLWDESENWGGKRLSPA